MPFLGKTPAQGFVNSVTKDDFTPNGTTTAFTLSKAPATVNEIEVYVGNVRQEPTDAYSVSGTTLTMTEAPATGTNFYVMHIGGTTQSSTVLPGGSTVPGALSVSGALTSGALTAASVTSTGNVTAPSDIIVGSLARSAFTFVDSNPLLVGPNVNTNAGASFRTAGGAEAFIQQNANGTAYIGTVTSHPLALRTANADRLKIDTSGRVTKPYQPYFVATMRPVSGGATWTVTAEDTVLPFNYSPVNIGSHFNTTTHRFTAPVAGVYGFTAGFITNASQTASRMMFFVNNASSYSSIQNGINGGDQAGTGSQMASAYIKLAVNDYVDFRSQSGNITAYNNDHSSFSGILIG